MVAAERRIGARAATALLLIEGYCSLAVEMIGLRVLVPVAGQSIGVTSIVVTAFLAALALGYRDGGRHRGPATEKVARNLAVAAAWSTFWLSHFGVRLAFDATAGLAPLFQVGAYAAAGIAPAAYLLAQTVVLLVASQREGEAQGKAGAAFSASTLGNVAGGLLTALVVMRYLGVAFSASTLGNVAGGLLTALVVMRYLGVAAAVLSVAVLLLAAAVAASPRPRWRLWSAGVVAAAVGGVNLAVERNAFALATAHADYAIEENAYGERLLRVNGQNASREDGAGVGHPYIEWIEDRVYGRPAGGRPARVLVIGAGGFTFGRGRSSSAAVIVYVDIDARLPEVADAFLAPRRRSGGYAPMDGRAYLLRHGEAFDAILLDAFSDRATMPAHLYSREFFGLARSRLAGDGGTLYVNLIASRRTDRLSTRIDRTLRSVFAWCETSPVGDPSGWHNRIYACSRHPLDGDRTVYSDANTRGEVDAWDVGARRERAPGSGGG